MIGKGYYSGIHINFFSIPVTKLKVTQRGVVGKLTRHNKKLGSAVNIYSKPG